MVNNFINDPLSHNRFIPATKVNNDSAVYCPFIKTSTFPRNTNLPLPQNMNGEVPNEICLPNFSDRLRRTSEMANSSFGENICKKNNPVHIRFGEESQCYSDNNCTQKMNTCLDSY